MTGRDGGMSLPAPLHAGTGPISGFWAAPGSAGDDDVGRSMKPGEELAVGGGSSADTVGSPPPLSKSLKGREVEEKGGKKKRKKAVLDTSGESRLCKLCGKSFKSWNAVYGHMRVHKTPLKQQAEELASILLTLSQRNLNTMEGSETKGNGSAVAEGGTSSSAAEAQRKNIHMKLDLNNAPQDDENGDEEGA